MKKYNIFIYFLFTAFFSTNANHTAFAECTNIIVNYTDEPHNWTAGAHYTPCGAPPGVQKWHFFLSRHNALLNVESGQPLKIFMNDNPSQTPHVVIFEASPTGPSFSLRCFGNKDAVPPPTCQPQ